MSLKDLMPWRRGGAAPQVREETSFTSFERTENGSFDNVMRKFDEEARRGYWPLPQDTLAGGPAGMMARMGIEDTGAAYKIVADLPGLAETDVHVAFENGTLTIEGAHRTDAGEQHTTSRVRRAYRLGPDADPARVTTAFANGKLTVTVGKR